MSEVPYRVVFAPPRPIKGRHAVSQDNVVRFAE
jgi:hypothetical protein